MFLERSLKKKTRPFHLQTFGIDGALFYNPPCCEFCRHIFKKSIFIAVLHSADGSVSDSARGPRFDTRSSHILPLTQEGQVTVSGYCFADGEIEKSERLIVIGIFVFESFISVRPGHKCLILAQD